LITLQDDFNFGIAFRSLETEVFRAFSCLRKHRTFLLYPGVPENPSQGMAMPRGNPSEDLLVRGKAACSIELGVYEGRYPGRSRGRTTSSELRGISTTSTGPAGAIMIHAGPEQGMKGRLLFGVAIGSCDPHVHRADLRLGIALLPSSDVVLSWEEQ